MKHSMFSKVALKLSLNFAVALLLFALTIGGLFMFMFREHTLIIHKADLESRAKAIADTVSKYMDHRGGHGGYGAYIRSIDDIAGTNAWVIDNEFNLLTHGMGVGVVGRKYSYSDLPQNAEQLIKQVFQNKTVFSEDFSNVLSKLTLTVGVPINGDGGEVLGAVLLHSPVEGINNAVYQGFFILGISIALALLVSFALSLLFSYTFTKPLNIMNNAALRLADADYSVKTQIKQRDEIGELAGTLDILSERLDFASRQSSLLEKMRRDFVANISHELRTPVTVLRGSLEALTEKIVTEPDKVEEYYIQMLGEAKFLERLVGDLLDLSRLQNAGFAIEMSDISLNDVLQDSVRSAEQLAKPKGIKINASIENDLCVAGDYSRIRQMLMIVLDNAVKFSDIGGTVEVSLKGNELCIRDYGAGILPEQLPFIFDRFYKTRSEHNKSGSGLGLAIAKQIAERHGIETGVFSDQYYTEFKFRFL